MDPSGTGTQAPVPQPEPQVSKPASDASTNRQAIMFVAGFAVVLTLIASFAYYFVFIGPYAAPGDELALFTDDFKSEPTVAPPTPTPTTNPWLIIKQAYANPFEEETQYANPFAEDNPFEDLE